MNILDGLNSKQREAVEVTEGPSLILAGAGSGKTRALTHRIAYLIYEKKIPPQNILAVTFTNKAANEMKERVSELLSSGGIKLNHQIPWLGTFHSICVKILRREIQGVSGFTSDYSIFDSDDSLRAIKHAMRALDISEKKYNPRAIRSFISSAKGELIGATLYKKYAHEHFQEIVSRVFVEYEKILQKANALDFDDLIFKAVDMFQKNPSILKKYQDRFHYILVDEYQDTNHSQYIFLKLLAEARENIFVIGDDWQSIYSFRGAKFQNILDFKKDYPKAKTIYLEENYRSTDKILEAAQAVIKKNEMRSDKNLYTEKRGGAPVVVAAAPDKLTEIEFILDEVLSLKEGEGRELRDFVILYRTNAQSRLFEEFMIRRQIPYRIIGAVRFYERKEVKDIIAYLRFMTNSSDAISLSRIINVPPRGIGDKTLQKILSYDIGNWQNIVDIVPKSKAFFKIIERLRAETVALSPEGIIDRILSDTGYKEFLSDGSLESESRLENIEELKSAASSHEDLGSFLESIALISDIDDHHQSDNILTLMTIHSAKGLEFPVVFISGLEEGLFPHANSMDDQFELEEERRLMYVGMTRARERLYLGFSKSRLMYGSFQLCEPSRFLEELPQQEIELIEL